MRVRGSSGTFCAITRYCGDGRARTRFSGLRPGRQLAPPPVVLQRFLEENAPLEHRQWRGDELNPREQV